MFSFADKVYVFIILFLCGTSLGGRVRRIVRGTPVNCGTQPRAASLRNATTGDHICGATVVSRTHAITAAHCMTGPADQYRLQLRNYCVCKNETYPEASVVNIITHENYDRQTRAHDISVLQISLQLDDAEWLDDPVLPTSSFGLSSDCIIYGYGSMDPKSSDISDSLLAGRVETVSLDECQERLGPIAPTYDAGMICARGDTADACQGDSGGPMMCGSLLQGVSSYGQSCGVNGLPGVYASVGPHLNWIHNAMSKAEAKS